MGRARAAAPPSLGRHLLRPQWAARVVADADVCAHELVFDLGTGSGALIGPLLDRRARVVAVDIDSRALGVVRSRWGDHPDVVVIAADARRVALPRRRPFRVVANLPFGSGTAILRHVLAPGSRLVRADVVLQWEAARARAGGGRLLAAQWAPWFELHLGRRLRAHAFVPQPRVDGGVLTIVRRAVPLVPVGERRAYAAWVADRFRHGIGHDRSPEAWSRAWLRRR